MRSLTNRHEPSEFRCPASGPSPRANSVSSGQSSKSELTRSDKAEKTNETLDKNTLNLRAESRATEREKEHSLDEANASQTARSTNATAEVKELQIRIMANWRSFQKKLDEDNTECDQLRRYLTRKRRGCHSDAAKVFAVAIQRREDEDAISARRPSQGRGAQRHLRFRG